MDWKTYIHSNPKILLGKPVVKGTRLSVKFILGLFTEGWTEQQVIESYPTLSAPAIQAVFAFAAECLKDDKVIILVKKKSSQKRDIIDELTENPVQVDGVLSRKEIYNR